MGKYRFRLSDMIPNAWFYKLKDMTRRRRNHQNITPPGPATMNQNHSTPPSSSPSSAAAAAHLSHQRKSYYFTRDLTSHPTDHITFYKKLATSAKASSHTLFQEPPRKSSNKRRITKRNTPSSKPPPRLVQYSSVSASCSCRAARTSLESVWTKPDSTPEEYPSPLDSSPELESLLAGPGSGRGLTPETLDDMVSLSASCCCRRVHNDILIDIDNKQFNAKLDEFDKLDSVSEIDLPPIITKPAKFTDVAKNVKQKETTKFNRSSAKFEEKNVHGVKLIKEEIVKTSSKEQRNSPVRKYSANSPGVKLRTNSPRLASKKFQGRKSLSSSSSSRRRRSLSESMAVVKSSEDPQRDFKESMVEMIVENNIKASKDLEDLLACYLSLNSDEYHQLIINVFKQIWFDITDIRLK